MRKIHGLNCTIWDKGFIDCSFFLFPQRSCSLSKISKWAYKRRDTMRKEVCAIIQKHSSQFAHALYEKLIPVYVIYYLILFIFIVLLNLYSGAY